MFGVLLPIPLTLGDAETPQPRARCHRRLFLKNSRTGTDSITRLTPQAPIASNHTGNRRPGLLPRLSVQVYPAAMITRGAAHHSAIPAARRRHLGMFGIVEVVGVSQRSSTGSAVSPMRVIPPESNMKTPVSDASGERPVRIATSQKEKSAAQNNHAHTIPQEILPSSLLCLLRAIGIMVVPGVCRGPGR